MHLITGALGREISYACYHAAVCMDKVQENFREITLAHSEHGETRAKQFP